jgi:carbamoyltransferase
MRVLFVRPQLLVARRFPVASRGLARLTRFYREITEPSARYNHPRDLLPALAVGSPQRVARAVHEALPEVAVGVRAVRGLPGRDQLGSLSERGAAMLFLGMKITHDGGIALIDDGRLLFSVEMEKADNEPRHSELGDLARVCGLLAAEGADLGEVDRVAVDGWGYTGAPTTWRGTPVRLPVAPYREPRLDADSLAPHHFSGLPLASGAELDYVSFHHTTGHAMSAYCTSPFSESGEPSHVLVWDGGVQPRLYYARPEPPFIENLGPIFSLAGNVYTAVAMHLEPFTIDDPFMVEAPGGPAERNRYNARRLSVAGKVMAYTALGTVREDICQVLDLIYGPRPENVLERPRAFVREFVTRFLADSVVLAAPSADVLATLQHWLGSLLVEGLRRSRERSPARAGNLCLAGGCALNIKWNSAIRDSGVFERVFVPPFPNDSGSAIGTACAAMVTVTGRTRLDWTPYGGPALAPMARATGYVSRECTVAELAELLHLVGEPVVVLHGRAELGPRALGNRSILAPATSPDMKSVLNTVKRREHYRPVSPVCLEDRAQEIFDPGTPDPYMLFDHQVRPGWLPRIPAVAHLDGSARLQTVNAGQNPVLTALLTEYSKLSGVPVLCNTSANFPRCGFFPGVGPALEWGGTRFVWCEGTLWLRA